jgi:hypothetical protein
VQGVQNRNPGGKGQSEAEEHGRGCCPGRTKTACKLTVVVQHKAQDSRKESVSLAPKTCQHAINKPVATRAIGRMAQLSSCSALLPVLRTKPPCHQFVCGCGTQCCQGCGAWPESDLGARLGRQATTKRHLALHSGGQEPRQGTARVQDSQSSRQCMHSMPLYPTYSDTETATVPAGEGSSQHARLNS